MAVRQRAFHFSLSERGIVVLSTVVSFLLVFAFGVYIGKEVQAHKTAQETRTVRFPVEPVDHKASGSRASQPFPLTSKSTLETRPDQSQTTFFTPPVREPVTASTTPASQNKKRETAPAPGTTQDRKEPSAPDGWSIQVHVTKSQSMARALAAELGKRGYTVSVNRLTKNRETLYRLRVGTFTEKEAQRTAARLRREERFAQAYLVAD